MYQGLQDMQGRSELTCTRDSNICKAASCGPGEVVLKSVPDCCCCCAPLEAMLSASIPSSDGSASSFLFFLCFLGTWPLTSPGQHRRCTCSIAAHDIRHCMGAGTRSNLCVATCISFRVRYSSHLPVTYLASAAHVNSDQRINSSGSIRQPNNQ